MPEKIAGSISEVSEVFVYKREGIIPSSQLNDSEGSYCSSNKLAQPQISRHVLAESLTKSEVHARAIEIIANSVCGLGYNFIDDENAKSSGVQDFIESRIYDLRKNPISFIELNMQLISSMQTFGEKMLEVTKINKVPLSEKGHVYFANPKNFYVSCDRNSPFVYESLNAGWGSTAKQRKFGVYGQTQSKSQIYKQTSLSLVDPNYPIPAWYPVLSKIELNVLYNRFNVEFTSNALSVDLAVIVKKGRLDEKAAELLKTQLKSYSGALYAGKTIFMQAGVGNELEIEFKPITKQEDRQGGYMEDIDTNDTKILNAHGVDPKIYGFVQKNGISSGVEQLGAIQVFENMKLKPMRKQLEDYWDYLFKKEFAGYNTKLKFNTLDMTDSKTDSEIQKNMAEVYEKLKAINAPKDIFDEARNSLGLTKLTDEQYNMLMIKEEPVNDNIVVENKIEEE